MLRDKYLHLFVLIVVIPLFLHVDCRSGHCQPQEISTTELQAMMSSDQKFAIINVLPKIIYDSMHLPGSVNLPIGTLEELSSLPFPEEVSLPFPKDIPIVFYCMGYL